jgi:hypothetical protein
MRNTIFLEPELIIDAEKTVTIVTQFVTKDRKTMINYQKSWENMFKVEKPLKRDC